MLRDFAELPILFAGSGFWIGALTNILGLRDRWMIAGGFFVWRKARPMRAVLSFSGLAWRLATKLTCAERYGFMELPFQDADMVSTRGCRQHGA